MMGVDDNGVSEGPIDALSYATDILLQSPDNLNCTDVYGNIVVDGAQFVPNVDPCWTCHCQNGLAVMCKSVQCSPPTCRIVNVINTECCKFVCIDLPHDTENFPDGTRFIEPEFRDANRASFGVRLVASIVTSLIVIFLLVFMVHRIRRRRRTLISIRRLNDERRSENDDLVYMTNADTVDVGFELPPYEDLPPPYSPAKPWDISEESPPPYEPNDTIIQTDEAALPWRQTNTRRGGRDGTAYPLQIMSRSFPNAGPSDSRRNRPVSEDALEDATEDTEMIERCRGASSKPGIMSRSTCDHVVSQRAEATPDTCALQSVVTVLDNGSHTSQILRENFRLGTVSRRPNDLNGNVLEAGKVTDALLCSDALGETRRTQSHALTSKDRSFSNENTLEGTSETTGSNTLGLTTGEQLHSIRNTLGGANHQQSSKDASGGATRRCLLAEASPETVRAISAANAAWMSSGMTKRRCLDDTRQQLPPKIHSNKVWCEL